MSKDHLPPPPLEHRPEIRTLRLEDLLAEAKRGRFRIPAFQRPLRWNLKDVQRLLDSIYRGYPIGSLIFWEKEAQAQELRFGEISIPAPARPDAWWIIDGQQRLVSLIRVLLGFQPSTDDFALYFDLDRQELTPASAMKTQPVDPSRWLPMAVVLYPDQLSRWLQDLQPTAERKDKAIRVARHFREYEVPAHIIHVADESTSSMVFSRINTTARSLEKSDAANAQQRSRKKNHPATLVDISNELREFTFGQVEEHILHRLIKALADSGSRTGTLQKSSLPEAIAAPEIYAATTKAAREVIQFLKRDAGIPHYELLPCKQPFVMLGVFFHHHPAPLPRSRELLARWLWRGALSGTNTRYNMPSPREMEKIGQLAEEPAIQRMLGQVDSTLQGPALARKPFDFSTSTAKLHTLALINLQPRHLQTGARLAIPELFDRFRKDEAAPTPAIVLRPSNGLAASIANHLVHPRQDGLQQMLAASTDPALLHSHGVTAEAHAALRLGDVDAFLELRARTLEEQFQNFFTYRARWDDTDRPSINSLTISEED